MVTVDLYALSLHDALPIYLVRNMQLFQGSGALLALIATANPQSVFQLALEYPLKLRLLSPYFRAQRADRKSTRLNSNHVAISDADFRLKKQITSIHHFDHK